MRKLRAPPQAGWLHVMLRHGPSDAMAAAVSRLGEVCERLPLDLHGYCFLPGHAHLLVRAEAAVALRAAAMVHADADPRTTRCLDVALGRHLMEISRYVHLNPLRAGLVWRPEAWPFSSLRGYLGDPSAPGWLVTAAVLERFGTIGARHRYRAFVHAGLQRGTRDVNGRPHWSRRLGSEPETEDRAWRIEPVLTLSPAVAAGA
jgi:hypothetical protein